VKCRECGRKKRAHDLRVLPRSVVADRIANAERAEHERAVVERRIAIADAAAERADAAAERADSSAERAGVECRVVEHSSANSAAEHATAERACAERACAERAVVERSAVKRFDDKRFIAEASVAQRFVVERSFIQCCSVERAVIERSRAEHAVADRATAELVRERTDNGPDADRCAASSLRACVEHDPARDNDHQRIQACTAGRIELDHSSRFERAAIRSAVAIGGSAVAIGRSAVAIGGRAVGIGWRAGRFARDPAQVLAAGGSVSGGFERGRARGIVL
jgi:hypothetical protein